MHIALPNLMLPINEPSRHHYNPHNLEAGQELEDISCQGNKTSLVETILHDPQWEINRGSETMQGTRSLLPRQHQGQQRNPPRGTDRTKAPSEV